MAQLKLLAYAHRVQNAPLIREQIQRIEAWATSQRHLLMKFQDIQVASGDREFPPLERVLGAVKRGEVNAVGVVSVAALGGAPEGLTSVVRGLAGRAHVVVVGAGDARVLSPAELTTALEIGTSLYSDWLAARRRDRPRRVCPPRVAVDVDRVLELQSQGRTLEAISSILGVSRPTISRRLSAFRSSDRSP